MGIASTSSPFDDLRAMIADAPGPDDDAVAAVRNRDSRLTKPLGSLGRLEEIVEWLAAWQGSPKPIVEKPLVAVFAANHGVATQGVSAFPSDVTVQMVANFAAGGAAINQICNAYQLGLKVFELALDIPTPDISRQDAFDVRSCAATIAYGMEAIEGGIDLLCLGEMGIANTTIAAAIYTALFGGGADQWCGHGTGIDQDGLARKIDCVTRSLDRVGPVQDPLEILRRLGGREIAAMVGAIIAARTQQVPVIVDGFVATAAAAILHCIDPHAIDHCLFAHCSAERAHREVLERIGKKPLFDLGLRLGEGTGAAIAAGLVRAAAATHAGMATFDQAGVSKRGRS